MNRQGCEDAVFTRAVNPQHAAVFFALDPQTMSRGHAVAACDQEVMNPDECARRYAPLVKRIARYVIRALPHNVELNDLIQLGMMGMLEATRRYSSAQGSSFASFATSRIRGAMLDGLRQADTAPRRLRVATRRIDAAIGRLEQAHHRAPSAGAIACELGWPLTKYREVVKQAHYHQCEYREDITGNAVLDGGRNNASADPLHQLLEASKSEALRAEIGQLPERERTVVELYYWKELKLREIGGVLGISETRVSQILGHAVAGLRARAGPLSALSL